MGQGLAADPLELWDYRVVTARKKPRVELVIVSPLTCAEPFSSTNELVTRCHSVGETARLEEVKT